MNTPKPPSINGWAPWIAVILAVALPTAAWLVSMGQYRAQQESTDRISAANAAKLERIDEKMGTVGSDVAVIKVRLERLEVDMKQRDEDAKDRR